LNSEVYGLNKALSTFLQRSEVEIYFRIKCKYNVEHIMLAFLLQQNTSFVLNLSKCTLWIWGPRSLCNNRTFADWRD